VRALVISDLHSNAAALRAVMKRVRRKKYDTVLCLGDFVGYGAEPNQIVDAVRAMRGRKVFIRGNHDRVAAGLDTADSFNQAARTSALWTREQLRATNKRFLENLTVGPLLHHDVLLCHGSPYDEDEYIFNVHHAAQILGTYKAPFIMFGHTHLPVIFSIDENHNVSGAAIGDERTIRLAPHLRYLINPGSVGQPRDRNPAASCVILDTDKRTVQFLRVPYDVAASQAQIRAAGLPEILAARLSVGT
jgi:predicted phosphodiesterase